MYKRILVAIHGDRSSQRVLREAVDLAADQGAQLRILHVVDVSPHGHPELGVTVHVFEETCQAWGRSVLDEASALVRRAGIEAQTAMREADERHLSRAIVDEALRSRADLIVLGARDHRGLGRWFSRGIVEGVRRGTAVPVLLVHAP